jgi:hypothetical protein
MNSENTVTKVTQVLQRNCGAEAKIVAQVMTGAGLHRSVDVTVFKREHSGQTWSLCNYRPHPDWRKMSVDDYVNHGRSEMLKTVTPGEILKVSSLLGQPMPEVEAWAQV